MAQFLRPDSNVTQTNFTNGFANIDESVASDADFAFGANNTAAILEVGLSDPSGTPGSGTTTVRYRHAKVNNGVLDGGGNGVTITAEVVQGTNVIASDAAQNTSGAWTTRTWTPDLSLISNWNDVRLRFTTSASGGSPANRRGGAVSFTELEVPDAAAAQDVTPSLFTNTNSFFAPDVTTEYNVDPSLFTNDQTFFGPTITTEVSVDVSLFTNEQTFFSPDVVAEGGDQTVTPSLFTNAQVFHGPAITTEYTIDPSRFDDEQIFFAPTITTDFTIEPGLFVNQQQFFALTVDGGSTPAGWGCSKLLMIFEGDGRAAI